MTESRFETKHYPVEIRYRKENKQLEVDWDDGRTVIYPAEFLRVESPSAEVQGHGPSQKTLVPGRMHVGIMEIIPVGHYAVRLKFDDLHDTGIYSWQYLREIGENHDAIWAEYLARMEEKGLSRDPRAKRS